MKNRSNDQQRVEAELAAKEIGEFMRANTSVRSSRENIQALESEMLKHEQIELETTHTFCDGLYARQIVIPAGTILTGKIHLREHLNFIMKGEIAVITEHGEQRIKAPSLIVSQPGTKRAGYAVEETIWCTVHATVSADVEAAEQELVTNNYEDPRFLSLMTAQIEEKAS